MDDISAVGDHALSAQMVVFMEAAGIGAGHVGRIEGVSVGLYVIMLIGGERSKAIGAPHRRRGG